MVTMKGEVGTAAPVASDLARIVRPFLVLVVLLVYWISFEPFHDRSGADLAGPLEGGNIANQIAFPLLFIVLAAFTLATKPNHFRNVAAFPFVAFMVWLLITNVVSGDPATGLKRGLFEVISMTIAAMAVGLPQSPRQFANQLAIAAFAVLVLCYAGVAFLPSLSIHSAGDTLERELAGNWRGFFNHKNEAGAMMVVLIFSGLFIAEIGKRWAGWLIVGAASVFLLLSVSKTSIALVPFTLILAALVYRARSGWFRAALVLLPLVFLNIATVGSSWPGPIRSLVALVLPDASFTGRTDLWRFSLEQTAAHPIFGYGLAGPWRTNELMYRDKLPAEPEDISGWVEELGTDSHNSYLEAALQFGIPGLVLLLIAVIYVPLRDFGAASRLSNNPALARYFLRLWIYVLFTASLETVLVSRNNPVWFMALMAIVGMHLLARFPVANEDRR
ncbi:O-antigen ligase [Hyphomicrobium sp.]|uniref:O-antigen ligase family protein n=1 Tax=Hyphomicrobium sp. TaxID=82 RepID=UPI001D2591F4|nr:O-antigen ligase [Hyphomicrobium sp.]MBY0561834.1 O-antigen ligase family protein [Hyphomicrobium sp.]